MPNTTDKPATRHTTRRLHPLIKEAKENPYRLFTADELHFIVRKSINFIFAAKKSGCPFPGGVARPEWLLEWLKEHPDFVATVHSSKSTGDNGAH